MSKAQASSETDVSELAKAYGPTVLRTAHRILGDLSAAEDVQQALFLSLLEKPPRDVQSWPAWLRAAATRRAIDQLRKHQRRAQLRTLVPAPLRSDEPDEQRSGSELANGLRTAAARLPRRQAQVFFLAAVSEMSPATIAAELGLSENNVNVTLHRARKRLQTLLEKSGNLEAINRSSSHE